MKFSRKLLFSAAFALLASLEGCVYITDGDSETPDIVSLDDLQGCFYRSYKDSYFLTDWKWQNYGDREIAGYHKDGFCYRVCVTDTMAKYLEFTKREFWDVDTTEILRIQLMDSTSKTGKAKVYANNKEDGHFFTNSQLTVPEVKDFILEKRGDETVLMNVHGTVRYTTKEPEECRE